MTDIAFGVLGLGMGKAHCKAVQAARGARLAAICDCDPDRLAPCTDEFGVKAYASYDEMLADPEIQGICVATPSGMHVEHALQAVAAGKHVLVEKPVDVKAERIATLAKSAREAGVTATAVFQSRTDPLHKRMRTLVESGRLGNIIGVHAALPWFRKSSYYEGPHGSWKGTWEMDGGGSLMNQGIHTVDLLQWLVGPVASVFGKFGVYDHDIETEDKTVALLTFANGALGTLHTTTCAFGGVLNRSILIHGQKGTIHCADGLRAWKLMDDEDGSEEREMLAFYAPPDQRPEGETVATDPMAVGSTGHRAHIEDLVDAIHMGRDPAITIESAQHAVEIANAIYESGRTGREVTIDRA
ncbi:MAG: Gfo/Idh/MocA family oxidoreductase [Lentisphaeria bacterium]|nr:Gfo/Idh/MocA family oxidoreductase [Lentisphaeria bacterium]